MNDHEDAMKFMIKSRMSYIYNSIEKKNVADLAQSLGHLLADMNAFTNGLSEGK